MFIDDFYFSGGPSNDLGSHVARKQNGSSSTSTSSSSSTHVQKSSSAPALSTPLPDKRERERVAFGIKTQTPLKQQTTTEDKPRIVMHIKNGKVTTFEKSPNGKSKIVKDLDNGKSKSLLVPYGDDSDSDLENTPSAAKSKKTDVKSSPKREDKGLGFPLFTQKNIRRHLDDSVIFDKKLNATTSVPGNSNLLDTKGSGDSRNHRLDGLNLMVSPSKDLTLQLNDRSAFIPGKKVLGDNPIISCVTNILSAGGSKVNSTTNWQVFNQESAQSPSVGSSSSRDSVNSTTEWTVTGNKEVNVYPKVPERQFPGWIVQENDTGASSAEEVKEAICTSSEVQRSTDGSSENQKIVCDVSHNSGVAEILQTSKPNLDDVHFKSAVVCEENRVNEDPTVDVSDKHSLLSNDFNACSDNLLPQKKHKKHKKHKKEHRDQKYHELVNDSDSSGRVKKHKKKKHKLKKDIELSDSGKDKNTRSTESEGGDDKVEKHKKIRSDSDESQEFVWVEKTKDSIQGPTSEEKSSDDKG